MREVVFLLEEPSAQALLEGIVSRLYSTESILTKYIVFDGKSDLEAQLERRLRGYQNPDARFIVMRDQDAQLNCKLVKQKLVDICARAGKPNALVRIACRELESFYLADLEAVENALKLVGLSRRQQSRKFRSPDTIARPSNVLKEITKGVYQKVEGSRLIGTVINLDNQRSSSFRNLLEAIYRSTT